MGLLNCLLGPNQQTQNRHYVAGHRGTPKLDLVKRERSFIVPRALIARTSISNKFDKNIYRV